MDLKICFKNCGENYLKRLNPQSTDISQLIHLAFCPATMWDDYYLKPNSKRINELKEIPNNCPYYLEHLLENHKPLIQKET